MISKPELVSLNKLDRKQLGEHMFRICPSNWRVRLQYAREVSRTLDVLEQHDVRYPNLKSNISDYIDGLLD